MAFLKTHSIPALLAWLSLPFVAGAQISLTAENMALGGGGTAYLTGHEALFVNPANLWLLEKDYSLQISLPQVGLYFDSPLQIDGSRQRFDRFWDVSGPYNSPHPNRTLTPDDRNNLLDRNYPGLQLKDEWETRTDIYWAGVKWIRDTRSYAISLRTRTASRYELGRGFFTTQPAETELNHFVVDQSFSQYYQALHELSFGFGEPFEFLNGISPRLSGFMIGIAPKFVISGAYLYAGSLSRYESGPASLNSWTHQSAYSQKSTGYLTEASKQFIQSPQLSNLLGHNGSFSDLLQPAGIGAGLDIGITWLISFGNEYAPLRVPGRLPGTSLRLSLSVTDLGAIYHYRTSLTAESERTDQTTDQPAAVSNISFQGAPNEHLFFLNEHGDHPLFSSGEMHDSPFETMLPTSLQAGALIQMNRLKIAGDIRYGLNENAFQAARVTSYLGIELRPLPFFPLRAGTGFASSRPGYYSFGAAIESSFFDIHTAFMLRNQNESLTSEIMGASLIGIKMYIP